MNRLISTLNGELVTIFSIKGLFGSIRTKLFLSMAAIGFIPMILMTWFVIDSVTADNLSQMTLELKRQSSTVSTNLTVLDYMDGIRDQRFLDDIAAVIDARFIVLNKSGETVYDANRSGVSKVYSSTEVLQILLGSSDQLVTESDGYLTVYTPIYNTDGDQIDGLIIMTESTDVIEATRERLLGIVSLILLGVGLGVLLLNAYVTSTLTKPFSRFLAAVRRVSEGHIDERIEIKGNYEIAQISNAFNDMLTTIEQIDRSREQFVANVSHELKTPLSSMKVLAESLLIQEEAPIEFYREFMEDISSEVDRETQIINDLLTLVSLDKTENKLNLAPVNLNRLIEQVMRMLKPVAEKANMTLEIKSYRDITAMIDETKVYLILMNLIENGIKYSSQGDKVTVSINADHRETIIKVADTGIGIPKESVDRIFDRFYRVDKARSRGTGGTGLGLNIVHKTVLMHGGTIKCTSEEGVGTTFTVRLPLTLVDPGSSSQ